MTNIETCRNLYNEGKTLDEIVDITKMGYQEVHKAIKDLFGKRFTGNLISSKHKADIVERYKNGESTVTIGKYYGVSHKTIARILETHGVNRIGNGRRKYALNEHYFDVIDTQEKAYILGFLFADGSNQLPKKTISMSLQEEDKYILEWMRNEIESERPLEFIDYSNKHDFGYTYKNQYRLLMFSAHMGKVLQSYGMVQRKSYNLDFPSCISDKLMSHFIRGYFDGNGSITVKQNTFGNYDISNFSLTSTFDFCTGLQKYLKNNLNITVYLYEASNHNGITYYMRSCSYDKYTIFNWMYKGATCYLKRKYYKYLCTLM